MSKVITTIIFLAMSSPLFADTHEERCDEFINSEISRLEYTMANAENKHSELINSMFNKFEKQNSEALAKLAKAQIDLTLSKVQPKIEKAKFLPLEIKKNIEQVEIRNNICSNRELLVNLIDSSILKYMQLQKSLRLAARATLLKLKNG